MGYYIEEEEEEKSWYLLILISEAMQALKEKVNKRFLRRITLENSLSLIFILKLKVFLALSVFAALTKRVNFAALTKRVKRLGFC